MSLRFIPSVYSNLNEIDNSIDPPPYNSTVKSRRNRNPRRSRNSNNHRQLQGTQILRDTPPEVALVTNDTSSKIYLELYSITRSRKIIEENSENKVIYSLSIGGVIILGVITALITVTVFAAHIFAL